MLRKLLKHEWKDTAKMGCLMLIALAGVTFLSWLACQSPMWRRISESSAYVSAATARQMDLLNVISVFTLLFYSIMLMAVAIGTFFYLGRRFYKTMYADEGYLTHTLPVTQGQLLFVKTFVGGVWVLLISSGIILSILLLLIFLVSAVLPSGYSMSDFWEEAAGMYPELARDFEESFGVELRRIFVQMLLSLLIGSFVNIVTLFGAISIGQFFTKHRILMAIVSYIGICVLNGILSSVIQSVTIGSYAVRTPVGSGSAQWFGGYMSANLLLSLAQGVIIAAVLYWISYLVNTRKLNLE